jgi:hypothetical protein
LSHLVALTCPRCREYLVEHEPGPRWKRFFECESCWTSWVIVVSARLDHPKGWQLVQGRKENSIDLQTPAIAKGAARSRKAAACFA